MRNLLFMGLFVGLFACDGDVDGDGDNDPGLFDPVQRTCTDYCQHQAECDDEVNTDSCIDDCMEAAGNCQADEQEQALDELDQCATESCDDMTECTVSAQLECYFGL